MNTMSEKSQSDTGNTYVIMCNNRFWQDVNIVLGEYLANFSTDGAYLYSKSANKGEGGYISVGATYNSYNYAGNSVVFVVDRALTREYGNQKGYALCLDLTADKTSGTPGIAKFSLTGKNFMTNYIAGVKHTTCAA